MSHSLARPAAAVLCLSLLFFCGCTRRWEEAGTTHYAFETWAPISITLGCIASIPAGWLLRKRTERFGYMLLILGTIGLFILTPGMFLEHVTLNDQGFTTRVGFWFSPTVHNLKFSDIRSIALTSKTTGSRTGNKTSYALECSLKNGQVESVGVGALIETAALDILRAATKQGIPIENRTGQPAE
jgi:hypothetical protein